MPGTAIPPPPGVQCRCCGIPIMLGTEMHYKLALCVACTACNKKHGDALEKHARALVDAGRMAPWHCVALITIDNAQLWGTLDVRIGDNGLADLIVRESPRPWQIVVARCASSNRIPTFDELIAACLVSFVPGPNTLANKQRIADEITTALCWIDSNVVCAEIDFKDDVLDAGHLIINVQVRQATPDAVIYDAAKNHDELIPPDIMTRSRGQA